MTITREQIADLREGDVVEISGDFRWPGAVVRGPLQSDLNGSLRVGPLLVRHREGYPPQGELRQATLTVISRAPRLLYVNHPRTKPVPGDVVRDAELQNRNQWMHVRRNVWANIDGGLDSRIGLPERLRLLVDGETGDVVPQDGAR